MMRSFLDALVLATILVVPIIPFLYGLMLALAEALLARIQNGGGSNDEH